MLLLYCDAGSFVAPPVKRAKDISLRRSKLQTSLVPEMPTCVRRFQVLGSNSASLEVLLATYPLNFVINHRLLIVLICSH